MTDDATRIREQFRAELEFATAPMHADSRSNYDAATKYAEAAIKSVFALNGGGLLALPALITLFKIDLKPAAPWIIAAGAVFIAGLICAAFTSFLGYLSAMATVHSIEDQVTLQIVKHAETYQYKATPVDVQKLEQRRDRLAGRSIFLRHAAVATGVVSLAAFIVGAVISGGLLVTFRP